MQFQGYGFREWRQAWPTIFVRSKDQFLDEVQVQGRNCGSDLDPTLAIGRGGGVAELG